MICGIRKKTQNVDNDPYPKSHPRYNESGCTTTTTQECYTLQRKERKKDLKAKCISRIRLKHVLPEQ